MVYYGKRNPGKWNCTPKKTNLPVVSLPVVFDWGCLILIIFPLFVAMNWAIPFDPILDNPSDSISDEVVSQLQDGAQQV